MEGKIEGKIEIVQKWLQSDVFLSGTLSYEDIASSCDMPVERVKEIHEDLKKD